MVKVNSPIENIAYLPFKECSVPYYIRFSARARRLQMRIKEKKLEVVAPFGTRAEVITTFIEHNGWWIKNQYLESLKNANLFWPENFLPGEELSVQGRKKILDLNYRDGCLTHVCGQRLVTCVNSNTPISLLEGSIRTEVISYLKQMVQKNVEGYTEQICAQLKRWPKSVQIRETNSRWGSCGIYQDIYINWLLILAPEQVLMYVVIHECCHLFYRSHGVRFWQKVESMMPRYKKAEYWLRRYGGHLTVPNK